MLPFPCFAPIISSNFPAGILQKLSMVVKRKKKQKRNHVCQIPKKTGEKQGRYELVLIRFIRGCFYIERKEK